jgi:hypothetical protein
MRLMVLIYLNGTFLEVFVTDTRQQALAAYERDVS